MSMKSVAIISVWGMAAKTSRRVWQDWRIIWKKIINNVGLYSAMVAKPCARTVDVHKLIVPGSYAWDFYLV